MTRKKKVDQAKTALGDFEGKTITGAALILQNAGDGLSQAMEIEPVVIHHGELVYLVIEAECTKVRYDNVKDDDEALTRVHILRAGVSTIVDAALVHDVLEAQRVAIEKAKGVERLPFDGDESETSDEGKPPRRNLASVKGDA